MRTVTALLLGLLLAGCSTDAEPDEGDRLPDGPGIDGPVVFSGPDDGDGMDSIVAGTVTLDGTCLLVGGNPAVWPLGTTWDRATSTVVLPGGGRVDLGERVSGGGGYLDPAQAARGLSHAAFEILRGCAGRPREVAFFNEGSDVTRDGVD